MSIQLTEKEKRAVSRIKARFAALKETESPNAFDRLVFENRKVPASVILYATGRHSHDDLADMVHQGYARRD